MAAERGAQPVRMRPARIGVLQWGRRPPRPGNASTFFGRSCATSAISKDGISSSTFASRRRVTTKPAAIAAEFVLRNVDIIIAGATPSVHAAKAATRDIPIVMSNVADPLATGLVNVCRALAGTSRGW